MFSTWDDHFDVLLLYCGKCEVALFGDYVDIMQGFSVVVAQFVKLS